MPWYGWLAIALPGALLMLLLWALCAVGATADRLDELLVAQARARHGDAPKPLEVEGLGRFTPQRGSSASGRPLLGAPRWRRLFAHPPRSRLS